LEEGVAVEGRGEEVAVERGGEEREATPDPRHPGVS